MAMSYAAAVNSLQCVPPAVFVLSVCTRSIERPRPESPSSLICSDALTVNFVFVICDCIKSANARALAHACRPAGNTAHKSTGGRGQSPSTDVTASDFSSGANSHSEATENPSSSNIASRTPFTCADSETAAGGDDERQRLRTPVASDANDVAR